MKVTQLSPGFIHHDQEESLRAGIGGPWINRVATYLNVALRHASRIRLIPKNPIAGHDRLRENKRRDKVNTEERATVLKASLPEHLKPPFELSCRLPIRLAVIRLLAIKG